MDIILESGLIVDGTGRPAFVGDIGVRDGRVVAVGEVQASAVRRIDISDRVVAPGFIEVHTHYDAQVMWDPFLTPSIYQGFTTIIGGNCGFSVAPLRPGDDYVKGMLARVESIPIESLEEGVSWDWTSFGEYLERLDGRVALNVGFFAGHSAMRRAVMGNEAWRPANEGELVELCLLLDEALLQGAIGFSSSWNTGFQYDHLGNPVPSSEAELRELLALARVNSRHEGTLLEMSSNTGVQTDKTVNAYAAVSKAGDRPINGYTLQIQDRDYLKHNLQTAFRVAQAGGCAFALFVPITADMRFNFQTSSALQMLPGWREFSHCTEAEKLAMLEDPSARFRLGRDGATAKHPIDRFGSWERLVLCETTSGDYESFVGWRVGDIAEKLGRQPFDVIADVAVADRLRTVFRPEIRDDDQGSWAVRAELLNDPTVLLGGSDGGAHLDLMCQSMYSTQLVGPIVREHGGATLERAVQLLTDIPARMYGLRSRGRIAEGYAADLVVFDPRTVGPRPLTTRWDLPRGASRIVAEANGVHHVFVNGTEVLRDGEVTGSLPGTVLRSGRDTNTVTVADGLAQQGLISGG